jgi:hypothetical protein
MSVITLHELELGVLLAERRDPAQGAVLRTWLEDHVHPGSTVGRFFVPCSSFLVSSAR